MKIELSPGDTITVSFKDSDGEFTVTFGETSITVESELPGNRVGGSGLIYEESFGAEEFEDEA